jgi:hypothetical protein
VNADPQPVTPPKETPNRPALYQGDQYFAEFLSNLKKMEALIFIPEGKIRQAAGYNLVPVAPSRAKVLNLNYTKALDMFLNVRPQDNPTVEGNKEIIMNFDNLEMVVFVKSDRLKSAGDALRYKFDQGRPLNPKMVKLESENQEKLRIKWSSGFTWKDYVPVELK